ncbi:MAG: LytTR family DNA-binding domain-containing protein, partial [Gemmatimonadota bacterium]
GPRTLFLPVDQINLVNADRNRVRLSTSSGEYRLRMPLGELGERLDPARFLQINRSQIIRLDAVKELHPWSHGDYHILLHDGTTLTWSRRYRAESVSEFGRGG